LLFLQAAGSDFITAHNLVAAVVEAVRTPYGEPVPKDIRHHNSNIGNGFTPGRRRANPEQIAERVERAGWKSPENLLVALAAHTTVAAPLRDRDVAWIASAAARIGDVNLLLEMAGVVFAFNTINRIASARRVQLEYRFLRELKPIRGWVERRLASLTGLVYDLSYRYQSRHSPAELLDRLNALFERLGAPAVPDVFHWLTQSPVVLEGVLEMLEANATNTGLRFDLWKEAAAIAVASRAMPGSGLRRVVDQWLPQEALPDPSTVGMCAGPFDLASISDLESACRHYAWQVANAAYTISDEQIREMSALGLGDAELLDLTLVAALFSALAIIEPISVAVAPKTDPRSAEVAVARESQVQSALREELVL